MRKKEMICTGTLKILMFTFQNKIPEIMFPCWWCSISKNVCLLASNEWGKSKKNELRLCNCLLLQANIHFLYISYEQISQLLDTNFQYRKNVNFTITAYLHSNQIYRTTNLQWKIRYRSLGIIKLNYHWTTFELL